MKKSLVEKGWSLTKIAIIIFNPQIKKYCVIDGRNRVSIMKEFSDLIKNKNIRAYILDHKKEIPKVFFKYMYRCLVFLMFKNYEKVFMYIAGHCSNQESNVSIREGLADKISLAKKVKNSSVCKSMSMETIARLACKLFSF